MVFWRRALIFIRISREFPTKAKVPAVRAPVVAEMAPVVRCCSGGPRLQGCRHAERQIIRQVDFEDAGIDDRLARQNIHSFDGIQEVLIVGGTGLDDQSVVDIISHEPHHALQSDERTSIQPLGGHARALAEPGPADLPPPCLRPCRKRSVLHRTARRRTWCFRQ